MSSKKKKSQPYTAISKIPFVGEVPILQDGTAIKQPIIQEESNKIQQVSITNSIPPLDITIKQIDFSSASQISAIITKYNSALLSSCINSGAVFVTAETASGGASLYTGNIASTCILKSISAVGEVKAGTVNWGILQINIKNASSTLVGRFFANFDTKGAQVNVTFDNGILLESGSTIELYWRRSTTAADVELYLCANKIDL